MPDLIDLELERGDDAEVGTGAPYRPEEIWVHLVAGTHHRTVREDHLHGADMVDRQAMLARHEAYAAGGGEAPNADAAEITGGQCPTVWRQERRDVHPAGAGLDADQAAGDIKHLHGVHPREVDDDPTVVGGAATDAVPATADRQRDIRMTTGVGKRLDDLPGVFDLENETRRAASHVGGADVGIACVAGFDRVIDQ